MYAWLAVAAILLICFLYAKSKVNISVEPFTTCPNPKETNDKLTAKISDLKDCNNLVTNNDAYQDLLLNLDEWAGQTMMSVLNSSKMAEPIDKCIDQVRVFNDVCEFKRNLNLAMTFLDKA